MHPLDIKMNDITFSMSNEDDTDTKNLIFRPNGDVLFIDIEDDEKNMCMVLDYDDVLLLKNTLELLLNSNLITKDADDDTDPAFSI